jgi:hypothetical protein
MFVRERRTAMTGVWIAVSCAGMLALLAPLLLPAETVLLLAPPCLWKSLFGVECPSCGMSRSFVLISRGELADASALNPLAPWMYGACVLNTTAFVLMVASGLVRWAVGLARRTGDMEVG